VNLLVLAMIIVGAVSLAVALMLVVRRYSRTDAFLTDTTRGSAIFGMTGTAFAVLLAFVVLVAFQSYGNAKTGAEAEAVAVVEMSRTAEFFTATDRDLLQGELVCYARAVVNHGWASMRDGQSSPVVDRWVEKLKRTSQEFELNSEIQRAAFRHLLQESDDRVAGRRERLSEADPVVTPPVWFILVLGGLVNIFFVLLFTDRRERFLVQASLMAVVTTMVVTGLVLVWFLDHPYEDHTGSLKPVEMRRSITIMEHEHRGLRQPCSPEGTPRSA
jgi:hypothetical protein